MFFRKRTTHKFPLIVFGLIALGIIIFGAILIIQLLNQKTELKSTGVVPLLDKENSLENEYFSQIEKLIIAVSEGVDTNNIIVSTKNIFLSVHVPADMRDAHLNAFLEIIKLEENRSVLSVEEVKEQINNLLKNILALKTK